MAFALGNFGAAQPFYKGQTYWGRYNCTRLSLVTSAVGLTFENTLHVIKLAYTLVSRRPGGSLLIRTYICNSFRTWHGADWLSYRLTCGESNLDDINTLGVHVTLLCFSRYRAYSTINTDGTITCVTGEHSNS